MTREIPLTKGKVALVDDEWYDMLRTVSWCISQGTGGKAYAVSGAMCHARGRSHSELMHRAIADAPRDKVVDHINGDTLDNRRANLRICTQQDNMFNSTVKPRGASRYRGVSLWKGKWRACIVVRRKQRHLGIFPDEASAALAYNRAATESFGKYAQLNRIHDSPPTKETTP